MGDLARDAVVMSSLATDRAAMVELATAGAIVERRWLRAQTR